MLIWLHGSDGTLGVEHGIVRAGEIDELLSAQALRQAYEADAARTLAQAREQADALVAESTRRAQEMIAQTRTEIDASISRGHEEGKRDAVLHWHEEQARKHVDKVHALDDMHGTLAEIVTTAVERMVFTESRPALYQRALKNVQMLVRGATMLTLRVSVEDQEHAHATLAAVAGSQPIDVVVDPSLRPGSCIFESDVGVLDASLETQLDGLRMAMARAVSKAASAVDGPPADDVPRRHRIASEAGHDVDEDDDFLDDEDYEDEDHLADEDFYDESDDERHSP